MEERAKRAEAQLEKTREQLEKSERQCSQLLAAAGELEGSALLEEQAEQEATHAVAVDCASKFWRSSSR